MTQLQLLAPPSNLFLVVHEMRVDQFMEARRVLIAKRAMALGLTRAS